MIPKRESLSFAPSFYRAAFPINVQNRANYLHSLPLRLSTSPNIHFNIFQNLIKVLSEHYPVSLLCAVHSFKTWTADIDGFDAPMKVIAGGRVQIHISFVSTIQKLGPMLLQQFSLFSLINDDDVPNSVLSLTSIFLL